MNGKLLASFCLVGLGLLACSSSDAGPAAPTSCKLTHECPADQACAFLDGSTEECVPIACAALSECNGHLSLLVSLHSPPEPTRADVNLNYDKVKKRDPKACAAAITAIQASGHCIDATKNGYKIQCDAVAKSCDLSSSLAHPQGTCCDGGVCKLDGAKNVTCLACEAGDAKCDYVTHPCCDGRYCDILDQKCHPLRENGEVCDAYHDFTTCNSNTCTDGKCTKYTPPPPAPATPGTPAASTVPCESSWCHGCTGTCCSYCAGDCQTRCSGGGDF